MAKGRVLVAAQPAVAEVLCEILGPPLEVTVVHSIAHGLAELRRPDNGIGLVVSTILFDDSRMLDFLAAVKGDSAIHGIPFLCCRVLATALPDEFMERLAKACTALGSVGFIDFVDLCRKHGSTKAREKFRAEVMGCLN